MRYLVDGYNVAMSDDATRRLSRDDMRLALVRRLATRGRELLGPGEITVVFDGGALREDEVHGSVRVRFSGDESADDVIVRLASAECNVPVTVVTSDRELRARVHEHAGRSAVVLPCSALWEAARPRRQQGRGPKGGTGGLPPGHKEITDELKGVWLESDE